MLDRSIRFGVMRKQLEIILHNKKMKELKEKIKELEFTSQINNDLLQTQKALLKRINDLEECKKELEEANRFKRDIIEKSREGLIVVDKDGVIRFANHAAVVIFGTKKKIHEGEIFGIPVTEKNSIEMNIIRSRSDNRFGVVEMSYNKIKWKKNEAYLISIHDITKRKEAEKAMIKAKKMAEEASEAKSSFLSTMSHEIRTPLNGVIMAAELLMQMEPTSKQYKYINIIKSSGDNLMTLISDILDFSKIEANQLEISPIDFNLPMLIESIIMPFSVQAVQKHLNLSWEVASDIPNYLIGDATRLRQIIVNLVGNAIKFTERGKISIECKMHSLDKEVKTCILHFFVNDTGIGIPAQKQSNIFNAFTQADSKITRSYGGTGLGLAICKKLIGLMDGSIGVKSPSPFAQRNGGGQGSSFYFTLPFAVQPKKKREKQELKKESSYIKLLLINDSSVDSDKRISIDMLNDLKMIVVESENISKGIEILKKAVSKGVPYKLVILNFPISDSWIKAVEEIKTINSMCKISIIILTSVGIRGDAAKCSELGISAYFVHPINKKDLLQAIKMTLNQASSKTPNKQSITKYTIKESGNAINILLVEDNEVNQEVIGGILKMRGFLVEFAGSGEEALNLLGVSRDSWFVNPDLMDKETSHVIQDTTKELRNTNNNKSGFDLILMDFQMPGMSGVGATRIIRKVEKNSVNHIPIIGLTGHAQKKIHKDCIQSGMDAFLSKPLKADQLFEAIDQVTGSFDTTSSKAILPKKVFEVEEEKETGAPINMEQALATVGGNIELLKKGICKFIDHYPEKIEQIEKALKESNPTDLNKLAHSLKGSTGLIRANSAFELAYKLEEMGERNELMEAKSILDLLKEELANIKKFVSNNWP